MSCLESLKILEKSGLNFVPISGLKYTKLLNRQKLLKTV